MSNATNFTGSIDKLSVAIVGMAGRFPGAAGIGEFWRNLSAGVESITFFSEAELLAAGEAEALVRDPRYVRARGILDGVDGFDAAFFGVYPREAQQMDPQHRLFLETAWEALEDAGYDANQYEGAVGVFGGAGMNSYLFSLLSGGLENLNPAEGYQLAIGNQNDFLATRVSYKLNLRGPSLNIQTACSTSLTAVHVACRSLLGRQCDMALAGGVTINLPQKRGYLFQEGMILSPDGHCRAFDAAAQGTVAGSGAGVVVLKRLVDAVADGDHIYAVIKGTAVNNDGSQRIGFTAPGVEGQAEVVATAQEVAGVEADTIGYIEAHGTGTPLGDPIEIAALTQVFREQTDASRFCAIGSVKTNIGHLDTAAGVTGLIKTALALRHRKLPPSLHFEAPNPKIDFANSPFYVNTELTDWKTGATPRRAGVSSFGIGGTNAHAVLEEAPDSAPTGSRRPWQLLLLSARTESALDAATARLTAHLTAHPTENLADAAYTLQIGRRAFPHRRMLVAASCEDAARALDARDPARVFSTAHEQEPAPQPVVFLFSGQGAQYVNMGRELYELEPVFREVMDSGAALLKPVLGLDLRELLYPVAQAAELAAETLKQTRYAQPALFLVEYAMARLWMAWGVEPQAMIGHSIGEYAAACLAGVFSFEEGLKLVALRGSLMQETAAGAMLSVPMAEAEVRALLGGALSLAAVNGPSACVVSGPEQAIGELEQGLGRQGVESRRLHTSHAFHSAAMDSILKLFAAEVAKLALNPPRIPYLSNLTGTWIREAEATDPNYYADHLRRTVRFADGVAELARKGSHILLEVGPGQALSTAARQHRGDHAQVILNSIRHPQESQSDVCFLLTTLGKLWLAGGRVNWAAVHAGERRLRVSLPAYPFERQRYWMEGKGPATTVGLGKRADIADWQYAPSWKRFDLPKPNRPLPLENAVWLLLSDEHGLADQVAERLRNLGQEVITVRAGRRFEQTGERAFTIDPQAPGDYAAMLAALPAKPQHIAHFWNVTPDAQVADAPIESGPDGFARAQAVGFYSLTFLAQALGKQQPDARCRLWVVTTNVHEVTGEEILLPEKATLLGPCQVLPQEYPNIACRTVDVTLSGSQIANRVVDRLLAEFSDGDEGASAVAYRGAHRWVLGYEPMPLAGDFAAAEWLRPGGVYLITGGLGNIGLALATHLARTVQAKLILVGRSDFPPQSEWAGEERGHPASQKIQALRAIEEAGGEVAVFRADVADEAQMRTVLAQAEARFGPISGLIHAAGEVGERAFRAIPETDLATAQSQFHGKIAGIQVLARLLRGRELDFYVLQSSLSAVLGGLGFAAYAAANHYLDAFARQQRQATGAPWVSVNWDGWRFADTPLLAGAAELAMTTEEGVEVFRRILCADSPAQVVISTGDLETRMKRAGARAETPADAAFRSASTSAATSASKGSRPQIAIPYVAPGTETERRIVEVWQTLLGIEPVGIHDNFFDLGGDSLLGTQLAAQLRGMFQMEFPLRGLFEDPTVAGAAKIIEAATQTGARQPDKLAEVLKRIESLSEAEASALLAELEG
jgi:acyl transferase domain-containing protein